MQFQERAEDGFMLLPIVAIIAPVVRHDIGGVANYESEAWN